MMKKFVCAVALLAVCLGAQADNKPSAGYMGLGYGATSFKMDCYGAPNCAKNDSGPKVFVGLNLNAVAAIEAGYLNFGRATLSNSVAQVKVETSALVANAAFRHAFIPEFSGVLRLGLAKVNLKATGDVSSIGFHTEASDSSTKGYWGLGLEYRVNPNMKLFAAADYVRNEEVRNEMYSLGVQAGF